MGTIKSVVYINWIYVFDFAYSWNRKSHIEQSGLKGHDPQLYREAKGLSKYLKSSTKNITKEFDRKKVKFSQTAVTPVGQIHAERYIIT